MEPPKGKAKAKKRTALSSASQPKKAKRPPLRDIDEQWQKYNKQLTVSSTLPKKKSVVTATVAVAPVIEKKKSKKSNPLLKHREPCDVMRDEKRLHALTSQMTLIEKIDAENHQQKALAVNVMPARDRQNVTTLSIGDAGSNPRVYSQSEFFTEMKRRNYERTYNEEDNHRTYPLQEMMGEQGFFSINNEHIDQVLNAIVKEKRNDIAYAKLTHLDSPHPSSSLGIQQQQQQQGDTSNKKLNTIFGGILYSFGYNRRTPQVQYKKAKAHDIEDRALRLAEHYRHDQLPSETSVGEYAHNSIMFKEIKRQFMPKYLSRHKTLRDTAALTPKTDLEVISREYILSFRHPPVDDEQLCANHEHCVFNTFSSDKNVRYIGKVFYTEGERTRLKEEEEDDNTYNRHLLCYECLIRKWTIEWVMNIQQESIPERPINYFTVMCKPGQYSPHCMLSMVENDKPTGIVGHVPRFSNNNLHIVALVRNIKRDNKYIQVSVPMLDETGMDF